MKIYGNIVYSKDFRFLLHAAMQFLYLIPKNNNKDK